jgi:hypothetical protein
LAGALYFVATHLEVRYKAWCAMQGGGHRNEETERQLAAATAPTRIFLARAFTQADGNPA